MSAGYISCDIMPTRVISMRELSQASAGRCGPAAGQKVERLVGRLATVG